MISLIEERKAQRYNALTSCKNSRKKCKHEMAQTKKAMGKKTIMKLKNT